MTLLPISRRRFRVSSKRSLSRWCKPIEGSSNTYMTPVKPLPIWLAKRMRCASPPERVSAERESDKYSNPTLVKNLSRLLISFTILSAIASLAPVRTRVSKKVSANLRGTWQTSWMFLLPTFTWRASLRKRVPAQSGQLCELRYFASSSRTVEESVSWYRRFRLLMIPSKLCDLLKKAPRSFRYLKLMISLPLPCNKICCIGSASFSKGVSKSKL